jgi:hypothetical protein
MAHTMLSVLTHITLLCLRIQILVSAIPTIGSGTGFCVADSDGTTLYRLSTPQNANLLPRWQNGAIHSQQTIVSRLIQNPYWERQCAQWFPTENGYTYPLNAGASYHTANAYTGGWTGFIDSTRLVFVSGTNDPWRTSQVVSQFRPGGPQKSTQAQPIFDVPGGYHTSDLITQNGVVNPECGAIQAQVVKQIVEWVNEYPAKI